MYIQSYVMPRTKSAAVIKQNTNINLCLLFIGNKFQEHQLANVSHMNMTIEQTNCSRANSPIWAVLYMLNYCLWVAFNRWGGTLYSKTKLQLLKFCSLLCHFDFFVVNACSRWSTSATTLEKGGGCIDVLDAASPGQLSFHCKINCYLMGLR